MAARRANWRRRKIRASSSASATPAPNATLAAKAALFAPDLRYHGQASRKRRTSSSSMRPAQSIAGHGAQALGRARRGPANQLQPMLQQQLNARRRRAVAAFQPPPLPGSQGLPVQFVITTTDSFDRLNTVAQQFLQRGDQERACSSSSTRISRSTIRNRRCEIDRRQGRAARAEHERRRQRHGVRCWAAATSIISAWTSAPTRSFRRCSNATA